MILVPDEVGSLQFDEISDRAVRVSWSTPKKSNGILIGYKLSYQIKESEESFKEEVLPPNVTSIKVEHLQVCYEACETLASWSRQYLVVKIQKIIRLHSNLCE